MRTPVCPYCREPFSPSRYRPDQAVCSAPGCQRERRAAYHRQKLAVDAEYREQCRESRRQWRKQHPDYMRTYRDTTQGQSADPRTMLEGVKNNVDGKLTIWSGKVFLVERNVKNILAKTEIIVITALAKRTPFKRM